MSMIIGLEAIITKDMDVETTAQIAARPTSLHHRLREPALGFSAALERSGSEVRATGYRSSCTQRLWLAGSFLLHKSHHG